MSQVRTFQARLPKGPHEAALDAVGALAGRVKRRVHARKAALCRGGLETARTPQGVKAEIMRELGVSGRFFNGCAAEVDGMWEGKRACAAMHVENLEGKLAAARANADRIRKALDADASARAAHEKAVRKAEGAGKPAPLPTRSRAEKMISPTKRAHVEASLERALAKVTSVERKLGETKTRLKAPPRIVFGGDELFRARTAIHPNDVAAIAAWREAWDAARSGSFMLIGGKDEVFGNKSVMASPAGDEIAFTLRLPDPLRERFGAHSADERRLMAARAERSAALEAAGKAPLAKPAYEAEPGRYVEIRGVKLPDFGRDVITAAIARNLGRDRVALTYRFVRDDGFRHDTLSAWRVMITITAETPRAAPAAWRIGVDVNVDHLALALIDPSGNPVQAWRVGLPLRNLPSGRRDAIIGDAIAAVFRILREQEAIRGPISLAVEDLDFGEKKREMSRSAKRRPGRNRTLSSFAYSKILGGLTRRAAREGVHVSVVNPAYTSLIGEANWAGRYGLTRHQGAAVAIARRSHNRPGMTAMSERVNRKGEVGGVYTRLSTRVDGRLGVWAEWAKIHRALVAASVIAGREPDPSGRGRGASRGPGPKGRRKRRDACLRPTG